MGKFLPQDQYIQEGAGLVIDVVRYDAGHGVPSVKTTDTKGSEYTNIDTGTKYVFNGTTWDAVGTVTSGSVVLASLDAGITPSHVVKYAGKVTWTGSGISKAATVSGVAATDVVVASISSAPTQAAYLVSAAPTTNTVTFVLSTANTSNDAVISYTVFRAAA